VRDKNASQKLYVKALDVPFKKEESGYLHTESMEGVKTFALWPLSQAAQSCFGKERWPDDVSVPQAWMEFDVDSVEKATEDLEARGYRMLVRAMKEPWGQTMTRLIGPEGFLVGVTFTLSMRKKK
jgi:hypothetical protein